MYQVVWQEEDRIEIGLDGELTADEFHQVIHQLESMCTMYPHINVMFDASNLEKYNFKILLDEFDFYKIYKKHLRRFALVSDNKFADFILNTFNRFTDTELKTFSPEQIEDARKWIFPSRLP